MDRAGRWGVALLLAAAPLPFGAVLGWTTALYAAVLGLLLALTALARLRSGGALPPGGRTVLLAGGLLSVVPLVQMVPLPPGLVARLAPATARFYAEARLDPAAWRTLSQDPAATADGLLWIGACTACALLVTAHFGRERVRLLLLPLLALGTGQAFYGILEFLSGRNRIFLYEKRFYLDSVTGTYINRNHFAGLMVMLLPVGIAWLLARLQGTGPGQAGLRQRLVALSEANANQTLLLALAVAVMGAGLGLSFSRAGVTFGLLAAAAVILAALWPSGGRRAPVAGLALAAGVLALAALPLAVRGPGRLASMAGDLPGELRAGTGRSAVWAATVRMAADHPMAGTGLGSFGGVFPRYRPMEVQSTYTHAHQDYLQWIAETGIAGGLAGGVVLAGLLVLARRAIRHAPRPGERLLAAGIAAGLGGLALHGLVDFNGHIPANTLIASALAGCLVVLSRRGPAREQPA